MRSAIQLRLIPIHDAFIRPMLMIGAERDLVVITTVLLAMLTFACASWRITICGFACWVVAIAILQRLANVDPQFSKVYLRHLSYRSKYPATSNTSTLRLVALSRR
jgi:type IV secretion system protein TrbD